MALRRTLLISGGVLALGAAGVWQIFDREGDFALGQARLIPPLLRARLGDQDRVLALLRRDETEIVPTLSARPGWRGERIELRAWDSNTLEPVFANGLVSVPKGQYPDAGILGAEGATVWIHIGGIGAASLVDGRLLADAGGLAERNPHFTRSLPNQRGAWRFEGRLLVRVAGGTDLMINPNTFEVAPAPRVQTDQPSAGGQATAAWHARGLGGVQRVQLDPFYLALFDADGSGRPPARLQSAVPRSARLTLWQARMVPPEPPAATPSAAALGKPATAPSPPRATGPAREAGPTFTNVTMVAIQDTPLIDATILADGQDALRLADPPGVLLLYRAAPAAPLRLARVGADGAVRWRAELPLTMLGSAMPGEGVVVLAGLRAGAEVEALAAIDLATGALRARDLSTGEAITA